MGDMGDDFRFMREQKRKHRDDIILSRIDFVTKLLRDNDHTVDHAESGCITVDGYIKFWVYTGWYSGKGIAPGRGVHNLIKELNNKNY